MSFQLIYRNNLTAGGDDFAWSKVATFHTAQAVVGRDSGCDLAIDDDAFAGRHFRIAGNPDGTRAQVFAEGGGSLYVNGVPVVKGADLSSGDELRVGHWIFRFSRLLAGKPAARRGDAFSVCARIVAVAIVIAEIAVVTWVPRRLRHVSFWRDQVVRQQTVMRLDSLRVDSQAAAAGDELTDAARQALRHELDELARHVRFNEERLTAVQWQDMTATIGRLEAIHTRLETGALLRPLPELAVDAAVRRLTGGGQ